MRLGLALIAALMLPSLGGCVIAAVPAGAAAMIAKDRVDARNKRRRVRAAKVRKADGKLQVGQIYEGNLPPPTDTGPAGAVPPAMQYLYGSGEAAALSQQSYMQLANFLIAKQSDRQVGNPVKSVVLAPGSTVDKPVFETCGDKPLAIVLDIDETALLNSGFEADQVRSGGRYDQGRWDAWEKSGANAVLAVPGAVDALYVARVGGIKVIFNSNRAAANADVTAAALKHAGLGDAVHGDTLWLKGDAGGGDGKDARRWAISAKYCVVAMVGDQLGDFSDLFNAPTLGFAGRRTAVNTRALQILWGQGWFMMPNPVYGTALKGEMGEVFPPETQWSPQTVAAPAPAPQEK